jgi:hypothetical protein
MPSRTFDQFVLAQFSLLLVLHAIRPFPRPANVLIMQNPVKPPAPFVLSPDLSSSPVAPDEPRLVALGPLLSASL